MSDPPEAPDSPEKKPRVSLRVIDSRELDRQLDRGALFEYGMHTAAFDRIHDLSIFVYATMEVLLGKGVITSEELTAYVGAVKKQLQDKHWTKDRGFAVNPDTSDKRAAKGTLVDCDARMELCKGVCCTMEHALQASDIQEGIVKWDHGRPYWIRHDADHRCSHWEREGGHCSIFEARPLTCRQYSCEKDPRVWKDFAARIPNVEGIAALFAKPDFRTMMMDEGQPVNVGVDTQIKVKSET